MQSVVRGCALLIIEILLKRCYTFVWELFSSLGWFSARFFPLLLTGEPLIVNEMFKRLQIIMLSDVSLHRIIFINTISHLII